MKESGVKKKDKLHDKINFHLEMYEKRETSFLFDAVLGIAYTADEYEVIRKNDLRESNRVCICFKSVNVKL